nr:PREDICTED: interferon-inducible GTPase 5-like [Latimeria chalumnae]|eukprot:XP_005995735.1 PREDICTED: interferon-inducible GTPase 5-like [Latimeria chalumnae]
METLDMDISVIKRKKRSTFQLISEEEVEDMKVAFEFGGWESVVSKIQENLDSIENVKLDIAITGESGSGKSTFVNAIRDLEDEDEGAAETGSIETTMTPTKYPYPNNRNINLWDLPGIGTLKFKADEYLQQVNFSQYDFFIIIASERFKENHAKLACEIQKMGKRFYFVRSKIDSEIAALKKRKKSTFSEVVMLEEVRKNSIECLQKQGVERPQVYLVSCLELDKFDFNKLQETLQQELSAHKRDAFLLSLPNISKTILLRKKKLMRNQIWKLASISCVVATIPIPGVSVVCNAAILVKMLTRYCKDFGLDEEALARLAKKVDKPVEDLKSVIKSPLAGQISSDLVFKLLTKTACGGLMVSGSFLRTIPFIGGAVAGGISFGATYYMLENFLDGLSEDAQKVLEKAFDTGL